MADETIGDKTARLASEISDATATFVPIDDGTSNFKLSLSQLGVTLFGADLSKPAAVVSKTNGTRTEYYATAATAAANGTAFSNAIAAATTNDTITLDPLRRYEPATGSGFSLSGLTGVKVIGGLIARNGGTGVYTNLLEFDTCRDCEAINVTLDGEAGISAPTDTPPTHQNTNGNNAGSFTNLITLIASHRTKITGCTLRDHAGTEATASSGVPFYTEAMGVDVGSTCIGTQIQGSTFTKIGYAGVADEGIGTSINGNTFDDCQWHGVVKRRNSGVISNNHFQRLSATTIGYQGGIDMNPAEQLPSVDIINNTFDFNYDFAAATGGMFLIKVQGVDLVRIQGNTLRHGNNGDATSSSRDSIRFEGEHIDTAILSENWMSGMIGHIQGSDTTRKVRNLKVINNHINQTCENRFGMIVDAEILELGGNNIKYARVGLTANISSRNKALITYGNTWVSLDTENAYAIASSMFSTATSIYYDDTNKLKNGSDATESEDGQTINFINRKSESATGRLSLATERGTKERRYNAALPANFDHGSAAGTDGVQPWQTLTVAASIVYDYSLGKLAKLPTPGAGNTVADITNVNPGNEGQMKIQGGINNIAWGPGWDFGDQAGWTLSTSTSLADIVSWVVDDSGGINARVVQGYAW